MKRAIVVVLLVLLAVGCGGNGSPNRRGSLAEYTFETADGRTVQCIAYKDGYGGGLSCDW